MGLFSKIFGKKNGHEGVNEFDVPSENKKSKSKKPRAEKMPTDDITPKTSAVIKPIVITPERSAELAETKVEEKPVVKEEVKPAREEASAPKEEPKPVKEEPKPVKEEPKPVKEEPKPVKEEPTPVKKAEKESKKIEEKPKKTETKPVEKKSEAKPAEKKSDAKPAKKADESADKKAEKASAKKSENKPEQKKEEAAAQKNVRTGRFEIKKTKDGRFVFNLYAPNHVIVATSQVYSSSTSAVGGIKSIINNAEKAPIEDNSLKNPTELPFPKWEIYIDKGGQYRFRLYATNGSCVVHSQGYTAKNSCKKGIESIIKCAKDAEVDKSYLKKAEK